MFRTIPQITDDLTADTRRRLDTAAVAGAVVRGELYWPVEERLLRLSSRYLTARREGRTRAAAAIKEMAMRLVEQAYGEE